MDLNRHKSSDTGPEWYYLVGGVQKGPVAKAHIGHLIQSGVLKRDAMLWKPGYADWVPADRAGIPDQGLIDQVKHPSIFKKVVGFVFGAACILWCVALTLGPLVSGSDDSNGPDSSSGKAMPLTRENIFRYNDVMQKPLQDVYRSFHANDLTKPVTVPPAREDSRFPKAGADVVVIKEMGYSYNLTMRAIAQHKEVLSERVGGDIFLIIGINAARDKVALRNVGLIDQETFQALAQAFGAE
jgi:hypothetical protein